jgi:hypothetical protein
MITYTFTELSKSDQKNVLSIAETHYRNECKLMGVDFKNWNYEIFLKSNIINKFFIIDNNYNILISKKYCRSAIDTMSFFTK